ncbi:MAG TPA: hydantoinase B/oxoprolinase family protein [Mariprofundaceae bacterium]|nr:hydantoinase B/oxoprolinase family protein [Mariprofundaceae bacterium]
MNPVELSLFSHRLSAICEEMGTVLKRSAISPNIKDREDYSCALFDVDGELVAQAAHIPVHLGSMAYCMRDIVSGFDWREGDVVVFNDPFLGGTHLPDITVVMPVFDGDTLLGFSASRAHHADVGGKSPGSMGVHRRLSDEGVVISPQYWIRAGEDREESLQRFMHRARNPDERLGDLAAQRAACAVGAWRLVTLHRGMAAGAASLADACAELLVASESYGRVCVAGIPDGAYTFEDAIEDDGLAHGPLTIKMTIRIEGEMATVDFSGTAPQCEGPLNCPLAVTAASVFYVFRCLMPAGAPQTSAIFRPVHLSAPEGSLVNATAGAAVAAGNVETSQRIVDVVLGALAKALPTRIPAASQGTMNNVLFGSRDWVYYETLGGGMGAHADGDGLCAVQCHMTNTRNSSIEVLEMHDPLRVLRYAVRTDSGGRGRHNGGDGLVRFWEVLDDCTVSLLSERRVSRPYGLAGGESGQAGRNRLFRDGSWRDLPAKCSMPLRPGDILSVETPGGGGYGSPAAEEEA